MARARQLQIDRYNGLGVAVRVNARADGRLLTEVAKLAKDANVLLDDATDRMRLSARGYHRVLRVSRTIADLAGEDVINRPHIAEALSYRRTQIR